jgi:hypothetical protein
MKYVFDKVTQQILGKGYKTWGGLYARLDALNHEAGFRRFSWVIPG